MEVRKWDERERKLNKAREIKVKKGEEISGGEGRRRKRN